MYKGQLWITPEWFGKEFTYMHSTRLVNQSLGGI